MNKVLKISLVVALALYAMLLPTVLVQNAQAKTKTPAKKTAKSIKIVKLPIVKKNVLGINTFSILSGKVVPCSMPDGKTIQTSQKDCDAVISFWNAHKPSQPSGSNNPAPSNSGNSNSGGSSNNNNSDWKPATPTVTSVTVLPCTSSSCFLTTIEAKGSLFTQNSTIELVKNGITYTGSYVGGNGSSTIIVDFQGLPHGIFDVRLYSPTGNINSVTLPSSISI